MAEKPSQIHVIGDSQCTIAALEKTGDTLGPYFCNRVSETYQNLEEVKAIAKGVEIAPVMHISGKLNPADLATRETGSHADLEEDSEWLKGPAFLYQKLGDMPFSREFLSQQKDVVPETEMRSKRVSLLATGIAGKDSEYGLLLLAEKILERFNNLQRAIRVFARVMKGYISKDPSKIRDTLKPKELDLARKILFFVSMEPTKAAIDKGDLMSLRPTSHFGIFFTQGRVGKSLEKLLGCERLPILMPSSRLAQLVMWQAHCEDHRRNPLDSLARSREVAWIVRGAKLARTVCAKCARCRLKKKMTEKQLMGEIPSHQLNPCPPFTNISLDFMGPYQVKGLGNQRARIKVYGLVIVCQNTSAVKVLAVPGYDTGSFLLALKKFTNNFGTPELIVSDRGSQLVKAGKIVNVGTATNLDNLDWTKIVEATTKSGTTWKFVEAGCQWRNGLCERQIGSLKKTLETTLENSPNLNIIELDTLFSSAANIVNQRPLAVQSFGQEDERCITPNDLLLGRNRVGVVIGDKYAENDNVPLRLQFIEELETLWWQQWLRQVFPSLVPYKRWKTEHRNVRIGDVVLVKYASKMSKGDFRLARVSDTHPDCHGVIRTVTVAMRPRDSREKISKDPPHMANKPLTYLVLGVQRIVVIQPVEEQGLNPAAPPFDPSTEATDVINPPVSEEE